MGAELRYAVRQLLRSPGFSRVAILGLALGIGANVARFGALAVSRLMQQMLFDVEATDPLVYVLVSVALLLVAEVASFLPARRATRIDPVMALRAE